MALDVDGYAVFQAITARPDVFPDIRAEVARTGRALVVKQLKAKSLGLPGLRRIRDTLGAERFALILDGLTEAEARSLVTRLDKHHPDLKTAPADWPRRHLAALATDAEPAAKGSVASGAARAVAPKTPKVTRALGSAAFAAAWDGKDHDPKPKKAKKKGE
ncbi:hypothetical protein [Methylobacterium iners]|uniref:Uncharacterized protein n=1 Tax=Methylobacterium iners TaxID=418707 RepID=A0ABQ4S1D4_9HYPH|nr:hypothetical protein [Methylobacterium iners]GJD96676.1 hypothetical protein OCOJLMKI_3900 [Methylobacterium iners]